MFTTVPPYFTGSCVTSSRPAFRSGAEIGTATWAAITPIRTMRSKPPPHRPVWNSDSGWDKHSFKSWTRAGHRGTWCHPQSYKWYELDYFCASPPLASQVQTVRTLHLGFPDHVAKQALFHLAKPTATLVQPRHAAKTRRIQEAQTQNKGPTAPLNYHAFRGPSEGAKANRGAIQRLIHDTLAAKLPDLHPATSSSSSTPASTTSTPWEIYTDGSCEVAVARQGRRKPAGWGIALQNNKGAWQIFHGPVVFDRGKEDFLGATLASNNTAELCAIAHAMRFLLYGTPDSNAATIFFDSTYAYKMATGQWTPRSNIALVHKVQELVQQVSAMRPLHWQHVYGHTGIEGNEKAAADKGARGETLWWPRRRLALRKRHRRCQP